MIQSSFAGTTRLRRAGDTLSEVRAVIDRIRRHTFEALVLTFAVAGVVEALVADNVHPRALVALLALGWTLPFLFRRRHPFVAPLVVCAALATLALVISESSLTSLTMPFVAALAAAVSLGLVPDRRQAIAGWAAILGTAAVVDSNSASSYSDFFWTALILTLAWFFGSALGTRTEQARELRERVEAAELERILATERATAEERARIARELHDVVAHSGSVMVVQGSGVRRLLQGDQTREREALLSVEQTGRQALTEMRRMLGVMRSGQDAPASLAPPPRLRHRAPRAAHELAAPRPPDRADRGGWPPGHAARRGRPPRALARRRSVRVPHRAG